MGSHLVDETYGSLDEAKKLAEHWEQLAQSNNLLPIEKHIKIEQAALSKYIEQIKSYATVWHIYISEDLHNISNHSD